jgi:hypothetical protein
MKLPQFPRTTIALFTLTLIMEWAPSPSWAWGREGHAIIAAIAENELTPLAWAQVDLILADDLDASGEPSHRKTLTEIASWADEIRATPQGHSTAPWHYEDDPVCGTPIAQNVCPHGQCIGTALPAQLAILADRHAAPRARDEALKWVVHLVGDLHQPLHAADHDDHGGNQVRVTWFGQTSAGPYPLNLHSVWDTMIIERMIATGESANAIIAATPSDVERKAWLASGPEQWRSESTSIARDQVYPALGEAFSCSRPISTTIALDERYFEASAPIVRLRLRQAGIRLGALLNHVLDPH